MFSIRRFFRANLLASFFPEMEKLCQLVGVDLAKLGDYFFTSRFFSPPSVCNPDNVMAVIEERRRDNDTESARRRRGR